MSKPPFTLDEFAQAAKWLGVFKKIVLDKENPSDWTGYGERYGFAPLSDSQPHLDLGGLVIVEGLQYQANFAWGLMRPYYGRLEHGQQDVEYDCVRVIIQPEAVLPCVVNVFVEERMKEYFRNLARSKDIENEKSAGI